MEVDPRWLGVVEGRRYTQKTAKERYPQLNNMSFVDLAFEMARKPKPGNVGARDVKAYLAADVDALVARLAAPEPIDRRWLEVEAGRRYTAATATERYPQLHLMSFKDLPFGIARRPKTGKATSARDVKTYLAADIDALVARLAAPEPVDPRWLDVEAGRCYTRAMAMERYPQLYANHFLDKTLAFEMARKPKIGNAKHACDVKTYLAADVDALVARLAAPPEPEPVDPR